MIYYRGTQGHAFDQSRQKALSFTPCLGVALLYAAVPGDPWSRGEKSKTRWVPTSTLHAVHLDVTPLLDLDGPSTSLADVLQLLKYDQENGITYEEVLKLLRYMKKRVINGPGFKYVILDEDYDRYDEENEEQPWGILTLAISYFIDEWEFDPSRETAMRLIADSFIFADAPIVTRVAERLGFRGIQYIDVVAAQSDVEELLDIDIYDIDCIEPRDDFDDEEVPTHETVRPLSGAGVELLWSRPAPEVAQEARDDL